MFPYDPRFLGGVNVAMGDVNADGVPEVITGAGPGGGPHVLVLNGTDLSVLASFFAFDANFRGGVNVAAGDVNGDGRADIITSAGFGGSPHVVVYSGADLSVLASFLAYDANFIGGVRVAAGDVNGDGRSDTLPINDNGTATPDSEAHFVTVKDAGTYYVVVSAGAGGTFGTYHLSVSVRPAATPAGTTYTSTDVPVSIPTGPGVATSTLVIPDDIRIGQLKVAVDLTHNFMADLDVTLTAPDGNTVALFTDVGSATAGAQTRMNLVLDDNGALPVGQFVQVAGLVFQPERDTRLEWFKGQRAQGTWTLTIRDDTTGDGGTLNSWSLIVVEEEALPAGTPRTILSTDFEANDGGFTHSGTQDEWEWGAPTATPIATASTGVNAWKTDLDNTYNAASSQDLLSPEIDLTGVTSGAVLLEWAMKFQLDRADFDRAFVEIQEVGGAGRTRKLWEWLGADMVANLGNPQITIQEASGWGRYRAIVNDFFGTTIRLRFHLDSDAFVQRAGLAIDDVSVIAFEP